MRGDLLHLPHPDTPYGPQYTTDAGSLPILPKVWVDDWIIFATWLAVAQRVTDDICELIRKLNMRLSPQKCGFLVSKAELATCPRGACSAVPFIVVEGNEIPMESSLHVLGVPVQFACCLSNVSLRNERFVAERISAANASFH